MNINTKNNIDERVIFSGAEPFQVYIFNMITALRDERFRLAPERSPVDIYNKVCVPYVQEGLFNIVIGVNSPYDVQKKDMTKTSPFSNKVIHYPATDERRQLSATLDQMHILRSKRHFFKAPNYNVGQIVRCMPMHGVDEEGIEMAIRTGLGREYDAQDFARIVIPYLDKLLNCNTSKIIIEPGK